MTRKVVTAKSAETLAAAATKIKAGNFLRLPVVDSGRKLVGVVSEFDLKRYADALESTRIESAMTRDPITVKHLGNSGTCGQPDTPAQRRYPSRYSRRQSRSASSRKRPHDVRAAPAPRSGSRAHAAEARIAATFRSTACLSSAAPSHLYASNYLSDA